MAAARGAMTAREPHERDIRANGLCLHYLDWGGAGPPIVLLHGLRDQAHEWDPIAPALTSLGRVLALDQRGHGESDAPARGYAPDDFAADVAAFCDALALDRPVVVGHSLGGRVAYHFAAAHPDRLRALVLVDIGATSAPETTPAMVDFITRNAGPFASPDDALRALLGGRLLPNKGTAHYLRHNLRQATDGRWHWKYDLDAAIATVRAARERDAWDVVARITAPTLLIRGGRSDVLSADEAVRLRDTIPNATLVEIPGVGHLIPLAKPRELAATIVAWLTGLPGLLNVVP
jgi:pimeloyl-ACP methyl ester carboxylesterase